MCMWSARNWIGDVGKADGIGWSKYENIRSRSSGVRVLIDMPLRWSSTMVDHPKCQCQR